MLIDISKHPWRYRKHMCDRGVYNFEAHIFHNETFQDELAALRLTPMRLDNEKHPHPLQNNTFMLLGCGLLAAGGVGGAYLMVRLGVSVGAGGIVRLVICHIVTILADFLPHRPNVGFYAQQPISIVRSRFTIHVIPSIIMLGIPTTQTRTTDCLYIIFLQRRRLYDFRLAVLHNLLGAVRQIRNNHKEAKLWSSIF